MEMYQLTPFGDRLASSIYVQNKPEWKVIIYLSKVRKATKDQILDTVPDANGYTLYKLRKITKKHPPIIAKIGSIDI